MDRRSHPRFPIELPVIAETPGRVLAMRAVNISRTGLLVTGSELLPVGSPVRFRLPLTEEIELEGGVARHTVHGCGVQFVAIKPEEQNKLSAYLDQLASMIAAPFSAELPKPSYA